MKKLDSCASVSLNKEFFKLITMSQGMLQYAEPAVSPWYLPPSVEDELLGHTLRLALKASRRISVEEFQKLFHSGVVQKNGEERNALAMKQYGYKSKRAMYKHMDNCSISVADGQIEIAPQHHNSLDGYSATTDGPHPLYIAETATDAELGAALREGFTRCTSAMS